MAENNQQESNQNQQAQRCCLHEAIISLLKTAFKRNKLLARFFKRLFWLILIFFALLIIFLIIYFIKNLNINVKNIGISTINTLFNKNILIILAIILIIWIFPVAIIEESEKEESEIKEEKRTNLRILLLKKFKNYLKIDNNKISNKVLVVPVTNTINYIKKCKIYRQRKRYIDWIIDNNLSDNNIKNKNNTNNWLIAFYYKRKIVGLWIFKPIKHIECWKIKIDKKNIKINNEKINDKYYIIKTDIEVEKNKLKKCLERLNKVYNCNLIKDLISRESDYNKKPEDQYIIHFDDETLLLDEIEELDINHKVVMSRRYYDSVDEFINAIF